MSSATDATLLKELSELRGEPIEIIDPEKIPCIEISDKSALSENPLVSVHMITYNHEPYIREAIEGVIKQEASFPIELVIGEDCSTDRTREIVLEYQSKHPGIIRVLIAEKNVGANKNSRRVHKACRGKYIAYCEGDDYWHRKDKLSSQVAYMEDHPDIGMLHTGGIILDEIAGTKTLIVPIYKNEHDIYRYLIYGEYHILTCTALVRRKLLEEIREKYAEDFSDTYNLGDRQTWFHFARESRIACLPKDYGTYRMHTDSLCSFGNLLKRAKFTNNGILLKSDMRRKYKLPFDCNIGWVLRYLLSTIWSPLCGTNLLESVQFCLMQKSIYKAIALILLVLRPFRQGKGTLGKVIRYAVHGTINHFSRFPQTFEYIVMSDER